MAQPSDKDNEVFFLAAMYFYVRYQLNARFWEVLQAPCALVDEAWQIAELHKIPGKDKLVPFFVDQLVESGAWDVCFTVLSSKEGLALLRSIESMFQNQEYCAMCEGSSYYDAETPDEFAWNTAQAMIALLPIARACVGVGSPVMVEWFAEIRRGQDRYDIVRSAVAEMLAKIKGTPVSLPLLAPIK